MDEDLPIGFEQDDEDDQFGVGTWTYADGRTRYGRDPELARELVSKGVIGPPSSPPGEPAELEAPEVAPPLQSAPAVNVEAPVPEEPEPTYHGPAPSEAASAAGLRPAGFQMSNQASESRTVSGGLPEEMAKKQQDRYVKAATEYRDAADDQRFREASRTAERARMAIEAGQAKELEGAAQLKQQSEREDRAKKRSQEIAETPINSRRAWQEAGAFNKVLGSMAVFLGGLSGRMLGGENQALSNIKDAMKADTQDQIENRNSQVTYWTRELGDAQAGVAAAELKKWQGVKERLEGNLLDEQSREVLERGSVLMKQIDLEIATNLNTLEKANYGNEVRSEQAQRSEAANFAPPTPRRAVDPLDRLLKQATVLEKLDGAGYTLDAQGNITRSAELNPKQQARVDAQLEKFNDDTKTMHAAVGSLDSFLASTGITRDEQTGKLVAPKDIPGRGLWDRYVTKLADGFGLATQGTDVHNRTELLKEAFGRMQSQGAITKEELQNFHQYLSAETEGQTMQKMQALDDMLNGVMQRHMNELSPEALGELQRRRRRPAATPAGVKRVTGAIAL